MKPSFDVCVTDFGTVRMDKAARYMDALDRNWREIVRNKRKRGKHAKHLRASLESVERAICTLALIEYATGGELHRI